MRESQKNRRTDETEGTGILWPEVSYDPEAPAGQNISFATEGRDADLSVRAATVLKQPASPFSLFSMAAGFLPGLPFWGDALPAALIVWDKVKPPPF